MDFEQARFNMVEQQIRPWDVLDPIVLDLLFTVRREEFVPAAHRALAFADLEIPLGHGEAMWAPRVEARVLQELQLRPGESVLEIGTGSGYFAALLGSLAGRVTSVEIRQSRSACHAAYASDVRSSRALTRKFVSVATISSRAASRLA